MENNKNNLELSSLLNSKYKQYFDKLEKEVSVFPFTNEDVKPSKLLKDYWPEKFEEIEMTFLQSLNRLKPGERIICDFNRKGESVAIVVDEKGKYIRIDH